MRAAKDFVEKRWGLRGCKVLVPDEEAHRHCHADVVRHCTAPCEGCISVADYHARFDEACSFLRGERPQVIAELVEEMKAAARAEDFTKAAMPWYEKAGIAHMDKDILQKNLQPRVEVFSELPAMVDFLTEMPEFSDDLYFSKKMKTNADTARADLPSIIDALEALPEWTETAVHDALVNLAESQGKKNGVIMWPARIAISGKTVTPCGAIEIALLLGREETLRRMKESLAKLQN